MDGQHSARSTRRPAARRLGSGPARCLLLLALQALLIAALVPTAAAASAHEGPRAQHGQLGVNSRGLGGSTSASNTAQRLSPRPTPSPAYAPLADHIRTFRNKPKPKLSVIRKGEQTSRRSGENELNARAEMVTCLAVGTTAAQINALFAAQGAAAGVLALCPSTVYYLEQSIFFTASGQGLQTLSGADIARENRAELRIASADISSALIATDCWQCDDILVSDLIINGGRAAYGSLEDGGAVLEIGGDSKGHTVQRCQISDTRGWSSLHVIEGGGLSCSGAKIIDNRIGPSGEPYNVGKIADGVSLSCRNSLVTGNDIFDATDGAIVIFGSPGTEVEGNTLSSISQLTLGAVNMVDYAPWDGDYTDVHVRNNHIVADGSSFKIGVGIGPAIWGDDVDIRNFGGTVSNNLFSGSGHIFGIAVSGATNFTVENNTADATARFGGASTGNCHGISSKVTPTFAIFDQYKTTDVDYGAGANCWLAGTFQYLLCYDPSPSTAVPVDPAFLEGGPGCSANTPSPVRPAAWKDTGVCLMDSDNRILIGGGFIQTEDLTVDFCLSRCYELQYSYAGMENANQCWCGNEISRGEGFGVVRSPQSCNLPCAANSSEICGGDFYGMTLYEDLNQVPAPFAPFAGTDWRDADLCLSDSGLRTLTGWGDGEGYNGYMTRSYCRSQCSILGFPLAALVDGGLCRCGDQVNTGADFGHVVDPSRCGVPCRGDGAQTCGGEWTASLMFDAAKREQPGEPFTSRTAEVTSSASSTATSSSSTTSSSASSTSASLSSSSSSSSPSSSSSSASSQVQPPLASPSSSCLPPAQLSSLRSASSARQPPATSSSGWPSSSSLLSSPSSFASSSSSFSSSSSSSFVSSSSQGPAATPKSAPCRSPAPSSERRRAGAARQPSATSSRPRLAGRPTAVL